jgi:hypothetical protein
MEIKEAIEILKEAFSEKVDEASKVVFSFLSKIQDAEMPQKLELSKTQSALFVSRGSMSEEA